tara:strand:- start:148 stop:519 length:372 start_codon:yes stop_codon:yes gene_type:complete
MRLLIFIFIFSVSIFAHDDSKSRSSIFLNDIKASPDQFDKIELIDNKYKLIYEKMFAKLETSNSKLSEAIQQTPFNEKKVVSKINDNFSLRAKMKLYNIKHHLEIEDLLNSYQRMKFNEFFKP